MRYIKLLIILGIVALLLYFFLHNINFGQVIGIISSVNILYPFVFLFGLYSQYFIRAYRWRLILEPHKVKISIMSLCNYTAIGFFLNTILPGKVGEAAKGLLMADEAEIKKSYGLASIVLERLLDTLMMFCLLIISLFFIKSNNSPLLKDLKIFAFIISPVIVLLFFAFYFLNTEKAFVHVEKFIRSVSKIAPAKAREKVISFSLHFVKGLRMNPSVGGYIKLLVSSFFVWVYLIPFYWLLMKGFEFGNRVPIMETIPYFCIIAASAAVPTPGMAGSFDAASRISLEKLFGVDPSTAAAYTILSHCLILFVMTIPGFIAFWAKGIKFDMIKKLDKEKDNNNNEMS